MQFTQPPLKKRIIFCWLCRSKKDVLLEINSFFLYSSHEQQLGKNRDSEMKKKNIVTHFKGFRDFKIGSKETHYFLGTIAIQVRFNVARFISRKEGICSMSVRNVGAISAVFSTMERTGRELGVLKTVVMATALRVSFCFFYDAHLWCQDPRTLLE